MWIMDKIRGVLRKMIHFQDIRQAEKIDTPLSSAMQTALQDWCDLYQNKAAWLADTKIKSLNLPAFISSEIARQILLEMQWSITGENGRGEFLESEFKKLITVIRQKLEQGCASGGMVIKPYKNGQHIYFDFVMDWDIFPVAFDDDGNLSDVIFPDYYTTGKKFYTRLERHTIQTQPDGTTNAKITQRAYESATEGQLGKEVPLSAVEHWKDLQPELVATNTGGQLFGWFKVAAANAVDVNSCMGASVFAKAIDVIREADAQFSRLLWEFEGSELAIDVDPTALMPSQSPAGEWLVPKLSDRLFRQVNIDTPDSAFYNIFSPAIRDTNIINGLNAIMQRVEDLCGLSRGTLSDANSVDARTATELKIVRQRSYATIADNQAALERALLDVIRVMAWYASYYSLAPEGEYDASFDWDDSILVDSETRMTEMLTLVNSGIVGKAEFRQWYFNETPEQAAAALKEVAAERTADFDDVYAPRNE